eukprot:3799737-Prymnesium_polylepis.1
MHAIVRARAVVWVGDLRAACVSRTTWTPCRGELGERCAAPHSADGRSKPAQPNALRGALWWLLRGTPSSSWSKNEESTWRRWRLVVRFATLNSPVTGDVKES